MKLLLVGATGFVGRHLARQLAARGHNVLAAVRPNSSPVECESVEFAALDPDNLAPVLREHRIEVVVNLAAAGVHPADRDPATLLQINALLPAALVVAAAKAEVSVVVQIGSSAEYAPGAPGRLVSEEAPLECARLYGATKAAGSLLARACGNQSGVAVAVTRLFNVFGPGESPHRLLPSIVSRLARRETVPLSVGSQVRDFMHVEEACAGIIDATEKLVGSAALGGCYNLATGKGTTVADFARLVAQAMKADPALLRFGELPLRPDDLPYVVGDPTKLKRLVGWAACWPLYEAVERAVGELLRIDPVTAG